MDSDVIMTVVGGAIGFVSSAGIIVLERMLNRCGTVRIYYKFVYDRINNTRWGVNKNNNEYTLTIPVQFELQNTSNTARTIRDLHLILKKGNVDVAKLVQIEEITKESKNQAISLGRIKETVVERYGGTNETYSFVLEPRSIQKQRCEYMYIIAFDEADTYDFDGISICYYNEKDKKKEFLVKSALKGWNMGIQEGDKDWVKL